VQLTDFSASVEPGRGPCSAASSLDRYWENDPGHQAASGDVISCNLCGGGGEGTILHPH